ncbi:O-acyltransferase WSD1, partial [Bienertia sinuspersici]
VEVNIKDHIKVPIFGEGLSREEYNKHFDDYISKIATSKIDQNKPLWELHIFNYPTNINNKNSSSATFIFKFHHAIADGTSLMGLVFSFFRRADNPSIPLNFPSSSKRAINSNDKQNHVENVMKVLTFVPKFIVSVFHSFYDFGQSLRLFYTEDDCSPIRSENNDVSPNYKYSTVTLSLVDVKRIKTILGVTVNDVVIGILFLGIRLYMREMNNGEIMKTRSTVIITLNIRRGKGYASPEEMRKGNTKVPWGNRFSAIELPITNLDEDDFTNPIEFIIKAHKLILRKRNTPFAQLLLSVFLGVVRTCRGLQAAAETFEQRTKNCSFLLTNMIGPTEKMSLAGHLVKDFYFMPAGLKSSLAVSVMSYMEMLTIGLAIEKGFIDYQRLSACLEKAFHSILQAATTSSNYLAQ